ncbi:hypothetical protein Hanom_Chr04g00368401 [Helianthus anomalus]
MTSLVYLILEQREDNWETQQGAFQGRWKGVYSHKFRRQQLEERVTKELR